MQKFFEIHSSKQQPQTPYYTLQLYCIMPKDISEQKTSSNLDSNKPDEESQESSKTDSNLGGHKPDEESQESSEKDGYLTLQLSMNIDTLDKAIQALYFHKNQFSHWKSKHPESESDFTEAKSNIASIMSFLRRFKNEHSKLLDEVDLLRQGLDDLKDELLREKERRKQLESRFDKLKRKADADHLELEKQKSIIRAIDIIRMYRKYYVDAIVGEDWGRFCEDYYAREEDVFYGKQTQSDFDAYLKTFDDHLVDGVSMSMIMKMSDDRHAIAHHDIRSAHKQQEFLTECDAVDFIDSDSKIIASRVLPELKKVRLSRMK
jgi:archaellum component FlaC